MLTKSKATDISVLNIRYPNDPLKRQQHPTESRLETNVEEKLESRVEDKTKQVLELRKDLGKHLDREVAVKNRRNINRRREIPPPHWQLSSQYHLQIEEDQSKRMHG